MSAVTAKILAANAHRTGKYADSYRLGASVASGEIAPAIDPAALGQGYRDGLKGAPWRITKKGAGSKSRDYERCKRRRAKLKQEKKNAV